MAASIGDTLRIVHLASLARCGETLVQRALGAHPQVHVVFDLLEPNRPQDLRLFHFLRVWGADSVPRWQIDQLIAPGVVPPHKSVLLLKQGIFQPPHRPDAFGLLRNPYASFCSLWRYDAQLAGRPADADVNRRHWFAHRLPRLMVWADCTVPWLLPALRAERDPVRQFLIFWRARVQQVLAQSDTVLRYEDFVQQPETELRRLCAALRLPFDDALLQSHAAFAPGQRGHGGIDLAAPIRPAPAWRDDAQVDLAPFVAEVDEGPATPYRGFYRDAVQHGRSRVVPPLAWAA